ncbi:MAG: sulfatase-like hydrolase/transferase, partial [Muribaculaceae bacterium]|nr:sulfatase-like hydrolase/transferase [Muribaculaceae bacterium]
MILAIAVPLTLIIPNVILSFTESMGFWGGMANVLLPMGVIGLLMTLSRRTGISALWFFPIMILSAFQIVLLFLYGESLIAVDMFLNVVTTNPQEVEELLGNLVSAILTVVIIYLPVIVLAIVAAVKRWRLDVLVRDAYRTVAASVAMIGLVAMVVSYFITPSFGITRDIFPINGLTNLGIAVQRSIDMANYTKTSADWIYEAQSERADTVPEVYILVIGETTRADNWQLAGYGRETNPRLSQSDNLVFFNRALTQSNTTHKSVPMLLSSLTADDFGENINRRKGLITAFNEAGYDTYFFSNQRRNHSYIDHFGEEADTHVFIKEDGKEHYDEELLPLLAQALADDGNPKKLIVLHTYGSHFNYRDRYPDEF